VEPALLRQAADLAERGVACALAVVVDAKGSVPAGKSTLKVWLNATQSCGLLSCNPDLDLYVRNGAKPTTSTYDCAPLSGTSTESCTITSPAAAWWYVGVNVYSGSSTLNYTVTAKFP